MIKLYLLTDTHLRAGVDGNPSAPGASSNGRLYYASQSNVRHFRDIVNDEVASVDLAAHLGDVCDNPNDFAFFRYAWSYINAPKVATIGNHDFDQRTHAQLADELFRSNKPVLGGSKFNDSFAVTKNGVSARIIMLDTNFNTSDVAGSVLAGRFHTNTLPWLQNELLNCAETNVIMIAHHAPHFYNYPTNTPYFNYDSAMAFKAMTDSVAAQRPGLKMSYFFGHHHLRTLTTYNTLGPNVTGYLIPASIEGETGILTVASVSTNGSLTFDLRTLNYPYKVGEPVGEPRETATPRIKLPRTFNKVFNYVEFEEAAGYDYVGQTATEITDVSNKNFDVSITGLTTVETTPKSAVQASATITGQTATEITPKAVIEAKAIEFDYVGRTSTEIIPKAEITHTRTKSERTPRMVDDAPEYYQESAVFYVIQEAKAQELDRIEEKQRDLQLQLNPQTATWALPYYERQLKLVVEEGATIEDRRSNILGRIRGIGNFNAKLIKKVAESFANGKVEVAVDIANQVVKVTFVSNLGLPPKIYDLQAAIDNIVHAHLDVEYKFRYLTIDEVQSTKIADLQAKPLSDFAPFLENLA